MFFVISGYLITSLILRDLRAGKFSLKTFFERRIRRILPALSVMVAATLLIGGLMFLPRAYEQLGSSAIAQALMVANVFFWWDDRTQGGYFGPASEERPLLHTWSLSVEEQFYLAFPLLLVWLYRFERWRSPRAMSQLLFAGAILGLLLAAYGVEKSPQAAFYLLPTRAWELLCGAWVAALPPGGSILRGRFVRESASWIGLAGVILPCLFYSKGTSFPGFAALPPCVGAALLIWSNGERSRGEDGRTLIGSLLAWRPLVFVGLISYSLYLWHWPVLVFGKYWFLQPETPWHYRAGLVVLACFLGVVSWRWVERPFREKRVAAMGPAIFRIAGIAMMLSVISGSVIAGAGGLPSRLPKSISDNAAAASGILDYPKFVADLDDVVGDRLWVLGGKPGPPAILLWGDSHGMHSVAAMEDFCREAGISGVAALRASNPPLLDAAFGDPTTRNPAFAAAVVDYVRRHHIPNVVLAARWSYYQTLDPHLLEEALPRTIDALHEAASCKIWVLQDVPELDVEAPKALIRGALSRWEDDSWYRTVSEHRRMNSVLYRLSEQGLPATFIDPAPVLLHADGKRYRPEMDGVSIYHDSNHLTQRASRLVLLPLFREALSRSAEASGPTSRNSAAETPAAAENRK